MVSIEDHNGIFPRTVLFELIDEPANGVIDSLMARDFDRQVAEIQIRVALLKRYTVLGIPVTEAGG